MEHDLILKNFLKNDNKLNKLEAKLSLEYLKCKIEKCYSNSTSVNKISHEDYEECKSSCMKNLNKFNLMKNFLYQDFTKFYYEKFLACSNYIEDEKFKICVEDTKKLMTKNVDDIKKILLNYNFSN